MKKTRIISLLFCLALLLCLIPVQAVKAEGNIVTYRFERAFAIGGLGSSADTHLTVTAIIDRETLKADVTFVRSGTTENDIKYIKENYPDSYEYVKHYLEQTHCHAIFDVEDYKNDDGNNGSRDYKLYDPVWDDNEPFLPLAGLRKGGSCRWPPSWEGRKNVA